MHILSEQYKESRNLNVCKDVLKIKSEKFKIREIRQRKTEALNLRIELCAREDWHPNWHWTSKPSVNFRCQCCHQPWKSGIWMSISAAKMKSALKMSVDFEVNAELRKVPNNVNSWFLFTFYSLRFFYFRSSKLGEGKQKFWFIYDNYRHGK